VSIEPYSPSTSCIHFIYPRLNRWPPIMSHTQYNKKCIGFLGPILRLVSAAKLLENWFIVYCLKISLPIRPYNVYNWIYQYHNHIHRFGLSRVNVPSLIHKVMVKNGKRRIYILLIELIGRNFKSCVYSIIICPIRILISLKESIFKTVAMYTIFFL